MLNWHSFHLPKYKVNVARNFIHRVCSLSTNLNTAAKKTIVHKHLINNGYPRTLINRIFHLYINQINQRQQPTSISEIPVQTPPFASDQSTLDISSNHLDQPPPLHINLPTTQPSYPPLNCQSNEASFPLSTMSNNTSSQQPIIEVNNNTDLLAPEIIPQQETTSPIPPPERTNHRENHIYRSIPYVAGLSERIIRVLRRDYSNITVICRQTKTIQRFHTLVKDPINKLDRSKIIYKIPCSNCEQCYIGMTRNKLQTRLYGHKTHINKLNRLSELGYTKTDEDMVSLKEKTALIEHCIEHDHRFDMSRTTVLDSSNHINTLTFLEMCYITNTPHTVNHRTDTCGLNSMYAAILQTIHETFQNQQISTHPPSLNQPLPPSDV